MATGDVAHIDFNECIEAPIGATKDFGCMSDLKPDVLQTDSDIARVAAALKKSRQRKQKSGRAADVKLKPVRPTRLTDVLHQDVPDPSQRRGAISQHLKQIESLPVNSSFAKHRRRMLQTALRLLDRYHPK